MGKLFNLKRWLTLEDAAKHLTIVLGEEIHEADLLHLDILDYRGDATMPTETKRYRELAEQIEHLLSLPMPIPAEKHLLRERIFALKYEQLGLSGDLPEPEQDQLARDFTLKHVPQNVFSYPMHLRETTMPVRRDYLKEYAARPTLPPTTPEQKQRQRDALLAPWPVKESPAE